MPPATLLRSAPTCLFSSHSSISSLTASFANLQTRNASILNSLASTPGSNNKRIRRGRGPSSGKGKTSGRGHKGQKQHGKVPKGFQGGQTPEEIAHGKLGFKNVHSVEMSPINLSRIQHWIEQGRLDPSKPITLKELAASRAIHGVKDGVKLLCDRGQATATPLKQPIHVVVSKASAGAIATVEALGGTVTTRYYTPTAIRRIRAGEMHPYLSLRWDASQPSLSGDVLTPDGIGATPEQRVIGMGFPYRLPDPTSRKDIEYYREAKNRGYLSHSVKEGESASLFFKPPISEDEIKRLKKNKGASAAGAEARRKEQNKLW